MLASGVHLGGAKTKEMWGVCQQRHNTTLNNTLIAPYHCYSCLSVEPCLAVTVNSASFTAFKKNIADLADLLQQMWFLLTIEMYKVWHDEGTTSG
jgi:hypothetical protein